jgi:hypothetical protein
MLVNNSMAEGPTSIAELEAKEVFATKAEAHKSAQPPLSFRALSYMCQITITNDDESPFLLSLEEALEVLKQLDKGLEKSTNNLVELLEEHGAWERDGNLATRALEHKGDDLKQEIGLKLEVLSVEYNAPTMWGSIGAIGSQVENLAKAMPDSKAAAKLEVGRVIGPFKDQLLDAVGKKTSMLDG